MEWANIIIIAGYLVTAIGVIIGAIRKILKGIMKPVTNQLTDMDTRQCRMFLIDFLNDIEHDVPKDEVQYKFAHDTYDHYTNVLKENSYVKDKWERVMK